MEDDLNFFFKWKRTLVLFLMEDNLNFSMWMEDVLKFVSECSLWWRWNFFRRPIIKVEEIIWIWSEPFGQLCWAWVWQSSAPSFFHCLVQVIHYLAPSICGFLDSRNDTMKSVDPIKVKVWSFQSYCVILKGLLCKYVFK